ncbi:hypothetical protein, partial [Methanoculleus sp. UBA331]|uniref:hypothetical protein n=1 Tax=Methanoculleus sp. UBA331 TaxID=1915502 RepID=UPI00319DA045
MTVGIRRQLPVFGDPLAAILLPAVPEIIGNEFVYVLEEIDKRRPRRGIREGYLEDIDIIAHREPLFKGFSALRR